MADSHLQEIEMDQVLEGNQTISKNYRFSRIGKAVPIQPEPDFQFESPAPAQPLVVSQRFHLLFVAHADGFYVARTEEVMKSAENIEKDGSGLSIQELSIADVSIGKVSILALSAGDSFLAASVGNQLHIFSVPALLHKEQKPSHSVLLEDSNSCIKDMKWASKENNGYLILSSNGKLYHGCGQGTPKDVMDNVDSVEWSPKGDFVALARKNKLSILSSEFVEKLAFSLSPKSLLVDCIKWTRSDSIVLGCFEGDDFEQANYLVQVISCSHDQEITAASLKPIVHTFEGIFIGFQADMVHANGPNLFLSYLDHQELAFIANRKNLCQHVVLLHWSSDGKESKASVVELADDGWCASIESQENGDDNFLLGVAIDKVFQETQVKFFLGEVPTEVSPCCILLCLTIDGKLALFHFSSAVAPSFSSETLAESGGKEVIAYRDVLSENTPLKISSSELVEENIKIKPLDTTPTNASTSNTEHDIERVKVDATGNNMSAPSQEGKSHGDTSFVKQEQKTILSLRTPEGNRAQNSQLNIDRRISQSVFPEKPDLLVNFGGAETRFSADTKSHSNSSSGKMLTKISGPESSERSQHVHGSVGSPQETKYAEMSRKANSYLKLDSVKSSRSRPDDESSAVPFQTGRSNSEQKLPKQLHNVGEMVNGMDNLLKAIGGRGGFMDASIAKQENSVATLEEGLWKLSEECVMWKELFDERVEEIKLLLDKTVQALARKTYVQGLLKQATDKSYWDLWHGQKLSSELELKRRQILETNQELTAQLFELERHLNAVELTKFGENRVQINRRAMLSRLGKSSQVQSLHSIRNIRNTVGAQLTVAQKLSECLSKQMAALNIESHADKQQNIKRELFENIGLAYDSPVANSPGKEKASCTPQKNQLWRTSFSAERKELSMKNHVTPREIPEPESVRRRRDSLDQNWSSYQPPRATVERMLIHDRQKKNKSVQKVEKQYLRLEPKKESVVVHAVASDKSTPPETTIGLIPKGSYPSTFLGFKSAEEKSRHSGTFVHDAASDKSTPPETTVGLTPKGSYPNTFLGFKSAEEKSHNIGTFVSPYLSVDLRSSVNLPAAAKQIPSASSSGISSEVKGLSSAHVYGGANKTASQSQASLFSGFPSTLPISTVKDDSLKAITTTGSSITHGVSLPPESVPQSDVIPSKDDRHTTSAAGKKPSNSTSLVRGTSASKSLVSASQPLLPIAASDAKIDGKMATTPLAADFLPGLNSENQLNVHQRSISTISDPGISKNVEPQQLEVSGNRSLQDVMVNSVTKNNKSLAISNEEDEMEEEASEAGLATQLSLGSFGIGSSSPDLTRVKPNNPFGGVTVVENQSPFPSNTSLFTTQPPKTELFRPASFSFQFPQPLQSSQPTSVVGNFTSSSNSPVPPAASGFGQPAQSGSLGTILGSFGQSRQIGGGLPGVGVVPPSSSPSMPTGGFASGGFASLAKTSAGGFAAAATGAGGFAAAATGAGGFAAAATGAGGFAAAAPGAAGGFAGAATGGFAGAPTGGFTGAPTTGATGGFAGAATGGFAGAPTGGFAGAPTTGATGGFAGAGFGSFGNNQGGGGGGGFSAFGSNTAASGRPPSDLFTQMRR